MEEFHLEETAYLISEQLRFEASIVQEAAKSITELDQEESRHLFHYMRGSLRESLENCEKLYRSAEHVLELAEENDLGHTSKNSTEPYLAAEKYRSQKIHNGSYDAPLEDVMEEHRENIYQAFIPDLLDYRTGFHSLNSALSDYELLRDRLKEHDLNCVDCFEYPLKDMDDAEIITETCEDCSLEDIPNILNGKALIF